MTMLDGLGIGGVVVMSVSFVLVRSSMSVFNAICALTVVTCSAAGWHGLGSTYPGETLLLVTGLGLFWFGLLIVRIMLRRSVSLRLLETYRETGGSGLDAREGIRSRLQEAERYRLVRRNSETYRLTWLGCVLASLLRVVYRVTKVGE